MSLRQLWFSWFLVALFFFGLYLFRVAPSVLSPQLMENFSLSAADLTVLSSCFLFTYTLAQLPVGYILGIYPIKRVLVSAILMTALGVAFFAFAPNFFYACLAQIFFAAFASFAFIGSIAYASQTLPQSAVP
jgi:sugar phosphate permease